MSKKQEEQSIEIMSESRSLPDDLLPEILSILPVKSLLRFRSVSKSWLSLIDAPAFARSHLTRFSNNLHESHLFIVQGRYHKIECALRRSKTFQITDRLGSVGSHKMFKGTLGSIPALVFVQRWDIISSIDGVFLLQANSYPSQDLILWNPSMKKARMLPRVGPNPAGVKNFDLGLGFDPSIGDYKHVRLRLDVMGVISLHSVAVYTFGTNSWKTIQFLDKEDSNWRWLSSSFARNTVVPFRGAVCFIGSTLTTKDQELVSFDLRTEVFTSTVLPTDHDVELLGCIKGLTLIDGGCSLAVVIFSGRQGSIWVMESFGAENESASWAKRYTVSLRIPAGERGIFLYLTKSGNIFLNWGNMVTSYNVETHDEKIVLKKHAYTKMGTTHGYMESLILLK